VVVAVLLDEFICFIAREKEEAERLRAAELEKMRITGCLDPLTKTLVTFDDAEDLRKKIDDIYRRLDDDDSGGLNFEVRTHAHAHAHNTHAHTSAWLLMTLEA
jgi:hypothetical protein